MQDDRISGALETFHAYAAAFQSLDAAAVARFFHQPAFFITPNETRALLTHADVERTYARVMQSLPPDYVRTEFAAADAHRLGDDLAMITGHGAWKNTDEDDMMPFGMCYTLRRVDGTWQIVAAMIHAPDGGPCA
ncbi:MAG: nuclear transport factor 2 family protein [Acidobacteria bacterium]|nr:nuclear transport factor 2 family protein [Acidobacteriota bacterium]